VYTLIRPYVVDCADILEVDIAFLVAVFILFVLSIIVAGKLLQSPVL